jgi:hypothetical protein
MSDLAYVDIPEFDSSVAMQRLAKRAIAFILFFLIKTLYFLYSGRQQAALQAIEQASLAATMHTYDHSNGSVVTFRALQGPHS